MGAEASWGASGFHKVSAHFQLARGGSLQALSSGVPFVPLVSQLQTDIPDDCPLLHFWFSLGKGLLLVVCEL